MGAPLWTGQGWRYLQPPQGSGGLQSTIENGWGSTEQNAVLGYCGPIVVLVYSLCMRMNLSSPAPVAVGLVDYVNHYFETPEAREEFRVALLLWYQQLYKAPNLADVLAYTGLTRAFVAATPTPPCLMLTPTGVCGGVGGDKWSVCEAHRTTLILPDQSGWIVPRFPVELVFDVETEQWTEPKPEGDDPLQEIRAARGDTRRIKLEPEATGGGGAGTKRTLTEAEGEGAPPAPVVQKLQPRSRKPRVSPSDA